MSKINPLAPKLIDEYINDTPSFAQPICHKLRALIHKADPGITEDWKWGPNFNKNGMICGFGAFKKHVTLAFFQGAMLKDEAGILEHGSGNEHNRSLKFKTVEDIKEDVLINYIREAIMLNEQGIKAAAKPKNITAPADFEEELAAIPGAMANFNTFAYGYRKEYIEWIESAKQSATREKRIKQAVAQIKDGIKMNDKYKK